MSEVPLCRPRVDPGKILAIEERFEPQSLRISTSVVGVLWYKRVEPVL
jgi:hypothetical protein